MVLDKDKDAMLLCGGQEFLMVLQSLDSGLGDQYVNLTFDCVECNWIVSCVWCENGDGISRRERINCSFVCFRVANIIGGIGVEGDVEVVVDLGDVLVEMLTWKKIDGLYAGGVVITWKTHELQGICCPLSRPCSTFLLCPVGGGRRA